MKLTFLIFYIFTEMSKIDSFYIKIQYILPTIEDIKKMFVNVVLFYLVSIVNFNFTSDL
jgi:hypothetical protein